MLGTPDYIAPEQIVDARRADIRADIYSLGCTFYYLLTGGPPFQATSLYEIFQAHHSMDAMPLNLARPEVPVELAALVAQDDGQGTAAAVPGSSGGGAGAEAVLQGGKSGDDRVEAGGVPGRSVGGGTARNWDDLNTGSAGRRLRRTRCPDQEGG